MLEAGPEPGAAWRERYDRLRLHTPRLLSGLPGLRIPRRYGRWVARDDLIEYLRDYAAVHDIDVRTHCGSSGSTATATRGSLDTERRPMRADAGDRRNRLQRRAVRPRLAGPRRLRRRARPLVAVPQPAAVPRAATCSSSARELRRRDRPRRDRRRREAVAAVRAHAAADRAPRDARDPGAAARDGDPEAAAATGSTRSRMWQRKVAIPDLADAGLPRPRARRADGVHHDRHDADPRRRHRRRGQERPRRDRRGGGGASTERTSSSRTARASSRTP